MIHICFCMQDKTEFYSKFVGTAMLSIFENISEPAPSITVHILHDNTLTDDNRDKFSYLAGRYNQSVKFYDAGELCAEEIQEIYKLFPKVDKTRFSIAMFYRFFIPLVLSENIEKAIYLDADIIVNSDITALWQNELGDKMLGVIPALAIGNDIHTQDAIVADGFVKPEDYFNSGVLLMNLKLLRAENVNLKEGMQFVFEHNYIKILDQTILNYFFSTRTLKLPVQFNQFVRWARRKKEPVTQKIYHYTRDSLGLDMKDPFNRLWLEYFAKTPWFNVETIGRLFESFKQIHINLRKAMINLSIITVGKTRCFFATPDTVDDLKNLFSIRSDEKIILAKNEDSIQELIDAMKNYRDKSFFIIMTEKFLKKKFPFNRLKKEGFVEGKDYWKGWGFLSEEQGYPLKSHPLINAM